MSVRLLQQYQDISPVTLQLGGPGGPGGPGGASVCSRLYCGSVGGLAAPAAGLVEAFLVEVYRCRLCQFTCGLKSGISAHLEEDHPPPPPPPAPPPRPAGAGGGGSPYRLEPSGESERSDEDSLDRMPFLLHMCGMLPNISLSCSGDAALQVAHTCEVSTLFEEEEEEESSIFPLKGGSVDLSCPASPPATQEEMAQSAHLMTLGLCRISASRPPAPRPFPRGAAPDSARPPPAAPKESGTAPRRRRLPCLLCPLTFPSRRLLHAHVRSHRAEGGFGCPRCGWRADGWEEMEPHWRSRCRRKRRRKEEQKEEKKKKASRPFSCRDCLRTFRSAASRDAHQLKHEGCVQRRHCGYRDRSRDRLVRQKGSSGNRSELDSETSRAESGSLESSGGGRRGARGMKKKRARKEEEEEEKEGEEKQSVAAGEKTDFCCPLCHRKLSTKLTLRRHMGIHRGEKPFRCPTCSYSTRLKASLLQHLRTHTGEKPYRCPECSYASIDRSSLLRHSRTHSQEKPYCCQYCCYSSIQKKSLDLHARRHHTGEAFPCQQCQYSSPDRQLLLRHIRKHHASSQHAAGQRSSAPAPDDKTG